MFYDTGKCLVNLLNVNSVGFNASRKRIVMNMNCPIQTLDRETNEVINITDYKYIDCDTDTHFQQVSEHLKSVLLKEGFIKSVANHHYFVNPKNVTYIAEDNEHYRIIFNFSSSVTKKTTGLLTNDYIFWTFDNFKDYMETSAKLSQELAK